MQTWPPSLLAHKLGMEAESVVKPPIGADVTDDYSLDAEYVVGEGGSMHTSSRRPSVGGPAQLGVEEERDVDRLLRQQSVLGFTRTMTLKGLRVKVGCGIARAKMVIF